jgi:hypothetical protein
MREREPEKKCREPVTTWQGHTDFCIPIVLYSTHTAAMEGEVARQACRSDGTRGTIRTRYRNGPQESFARAKVS